MNDLNIKGPDKNGVFFDPKSGRIPWQKIEFLSSKVDSVPGIMNGFKIR